MFRRIRDLSVQPSLDPCETLCVVQDVSLQVGQRHNGTLLHEKVGIAASGKPVGTYDERSQQLLFSFLCSL